MESTDPLGLEQQGWQALASTGEQAAAFYNDVLDRRWRLAVHHQTPC